MEQILESLSVLLIPFEDSLGGILWCIFIAACLALVFTKLSGMRLKKVLSALEEKGCVSEETAKTAEELGLSPKKLEKAARLAAKLKKEDKTCYYLPASREKKLAAFRKNTSSPLWLVILELVGLYALLMATYYVLPLILSAF